MLVAPVLRWLRLIVLCLTSFAAQRIVRYAGVLPSRAVTVFRKIPALILIGAKDLQADIHADGNHSKRPPRG